MAVFEFPATPAGTLGELWRAVLRLLPQLGGKVVVNPSVAIGTAETPVAHGLKVAPVSAMLVPQASCSWWQTKAADSRFVYFAASVAVTADVVVFS